MNKIKFTIQNVNKDVEWNNLDMTYIVGINGSGKTSLLYEMMDWCNTQGYNYSHYDAINAVYEKQDYLNNASNEDIILACKIMSKYLIDFKEHIQGCAIMHDKVLNDYMRDIQVLKTAISECGSGFTRFFVLLIKMIMNPTANYYFIDMPETSLHIMIARIIPTILMNHFEQTKFVIATHSPDIISTDLKNPTQHSSIIEL